MRYKEADGLQREVALDQRERERERERPRASKDGHSYTLRGKNVLTGWLHSVSIGIVEALQRYACSKKNMQRVYLRIIMLYFYRLKKNST